MDLTKAKKEITFENQPLVIKNLEAGNVKKDVTILGVTGSFEGSGGSSNLSGTSNTYFREYNGTSIVGYLFYISRNLGSKTTTINGVGTNSKSGTALMALMTTNTLTLSHTDSSSVNIDYGTQYAYTPSVSSKNYSKALGTISSLVNFVKSDGVTPFTVSDINTSKNYKIVFSDDNWIGDYNNMTNFSIKATVTEL